MGAYEFQGEPVVNSGTRYVAVGGTDSGPNLCLEPADPCQTIGQAVAMASLGDRILVASGTYPENVIVDKDLSLLGGYSADGAWTPDSGETIVDGRYLNRTFLISYNFV